MKPRNNSHAKNHKKVWFTHWVYSILNTLRLGGFRWRYWLLSLLFVCWNSLRAQKYTLSTPVHHLIVILWVSVRIINYGFVLLFIPCYFLVPCHVCVRASEVRLCCNRFGISECDFCWQTKRLTKKKTRNKSIQFYLLYVYYSNVVFRANQFQLYRNVFFFVGIIIFNFLVF